MANQEENLHFALIGDYKDGPEEHTKQDQGIIDTGKRLIEELNNRYARKDIFFLSSTSTMECQTSFLDGMGKKEGCIDRV